MAATVNVDRITAHALRMVMPGVVYEARNRSSNGRYAGLRLTAVRIEDTKAVFVDQNGKEHALSGRTIAHGFRRAGVQA